METIRILNERWTRTLRHHRGGVWWGLVLDDWVAHPAYRQARLVLAGGPTLLVPATDLQRAFGNRKPQGRPVEISVDPLRGTLNGHVVELQRET